MFSHRILVSSLCFYMYAMYLICAIDIRSISFSRDVSSIKWESNFSRNQVLREGDVVDV